MYIHGRLPSNRVVVFQYRYLESMRTLHCYGVRSGLGWHMTALYFRKFLLKTLSMPGKGFDSLKQWKEEKQLQILPALLRGNLVDYIHGP